MARSKFSQLDRKTVAVCFEVNGKLLYLNGVGEFYQDPLLGACLRISLQDMAFEVILREEEFSGPILAGFEYGCEYYLPLADTCQSKAG